MKVFITKYALSEGIIEVDAEQPENDRGLIRVRGNHVTTYDAYYHGEGKEWHRTLKDAIAHAETMRTSKIKSLEKSITKMRKLTF